MTTSTNAASPRALQTTQRDGLWERAGYAPGAAGTHAVVIGISQYENLQDNPKAYGLRNLFVSAKTAADFFNWLTCEYDCAEGPLQRCWLLLSPTAEEHALLGQPPYCLTPTNYLAPTVENLTCAIGDWFDGMRVLSETSEAAAARSRSIFFFSGHGLEVDKDKQLLLPSDYLTLAAPSYNSAVSTYNIHSALGSLAIRRQLFFVDACRNDVQTFRQISNWDGLPILDVVRGQKNRQAPILYASAPGATAWQPRSINSGSFFGQALLDALRMSTTVKKPFTPARSANFDTVDLFSLYQYIAERVQEMLQSERINQLDPICLGGVVRENTLVTRRAARADAPAVSQNARSVAEDVSTREQWTDNTAGRRNSFAVTPESLAEPIIEQRLRECAFPDPFGPSTQIDRSATAVAEAFGDCEVARFFTTLAVSRYADCTWQSVSDAIEIPLVERSKQADLIRVTISLREPANWHWIQGESTLATFATLLPPTDSKVRYRIVLARNMAEAAAGEPGSRATITTVQVSLSDSNTGFVGQAAADYSVYRVSPLLPAERLAQIAERGRTCAAIAIDKSSPQRHDAALAALLSAMILLRNGCDDHFVAPPGSRCSPDWLDALVRHSRYSSDAAILATQRMVQNPDAHFNLSDVGRHLRIIVDNGTPFSSEVFAYGVKHLQNLFGDLAEQAPMLSKLGVDAFGKRIMQLARGYRRGGFFTTFGAPGLTLNAADGLASINELEIVQPAPALITEDSPIKER